MSVKQKADELRKMAQERINSSDFFERRLAEKIIELDREGLLERYIYALAKTYGGCYFCKFVDFTNAFIFGSLLYHGCRYGRSFTTCNVFQPLREFRRFVKVK